MTSRVPLTVRTDCPACGGAGRTTSTRRLGYGPSAETISIPVMCGCVRVDAEHAERVRTALQSIRSKIAASERREVLYSYEDAARDMLDVVEALAGEGDERGEGRE